jgi:hypothetical protein
VKPPYYAEVGDLVVFASELKGFARGRVPHKPTTYSEVTSAVDANGANRISMRSDIARSELLGRGRSENTSPETSETRGGFRRSAR